MADVFEKRLRRAEQLEKEWPFAAELLGFWSGVLSLQQEYFRKCLEPGSDARADPSDGFRFLDRLIELTEQHGPPALTEAGQILKTLSFADRSVALGAFFGRDPSLPMNDPSAFFWMFLVQPFEMVKRSLEPGKVPEGNPSEPAATCPRCRHHPVVSVLREDKAAETVRRSLICSFCCHEWEFPRVLCPSCTEEKPEKLPRYSAQEIPWMRVEGCDTCGKYLKSVDLTVNWDADPVVDELASTPLDVIAHEHGYVKIAPNLGK